MQLTTLDHIGIFTFVAFLIGYGWLAYKFGRHDQSIYANKFKCLAEEQAETIRNLESTLRKSISNNEHTMKNYMKSAGELIETRKKLSVLEDSLRETINEQVLKINTLTDRELRTEELNTLWDVVRTLNSNSSVIEVLKIPLEAKRQLKLAKTVEQLILKRQTEKAVA
ncbi:hypothetical protein VQ643_09635 [Pseudomonas sp. F1_0610]|uniref:hypothetical protein n=1 Tax=Pseudomonas sp. F1_0610 TaxID=3114284 RepID=UPI0039C3D029